MMIVPEVGFKTPIMTFRSVDLPPPDPPRMQVVSRSLTSNEMPLSTSVLPKRLETLSTMMMADMASTRCQYR